MTLDAGQGSDREQIAAEIRAELLRLVPEDLRVSCEALPPERNALTAWQAAVDAFSGADLNDLPSSWPARDDDWPVGRRRTEQELRDLLAANRRTFELIDVGLRRDAYQNPDVTQTGAEELQSLAPAQIARALARLLCLRGDLALAAGDSRTFVEGLGGGIAMARTIATGHSLVVDRLIATAIASIGLLRVRIACDSARLAEADYRRLLELTQSVLGLSAAPLNSAKYEICGWIIPGFVSLTLAQRQGQFGQAYARRVFDASVYSVLSSSIALDEDIPNAAQVGDAARELLLQEAVRSWAPKIERLQRLHPRAFDAANTLALHIEHARSSLEWLEHGSDLPWWAWQRRRVRRDLSQRRSALQASLYEPMQDYFTIDWHAAQAHGTEPQRQSLAKVREDHEWTVERMRDSGWGRPAAGPLSDTELFRIDNPLGRHLVSLEGSIYADVSGELRHRTSALLTQYMLGLRIYELRFQKRPNRLQDLVKAKILPATPLDPYTGREFRYEPAQRLVASRKLLRDVYPCSCADIDEQRNDLVWQLRPEV